MTCFQPGPLRPNTAAEVSLRLVRPGKKVARESSYTGCTCHGAAVVEYYDHKAGTNADQHAKFLLLNAYSQKDKIDWRHYIVETHKCLA